MTPEKNEEINVGPVMPDARIAFTADQLRAIYDRIELIERHFDACCAFQMDRCHYGEEYGELYGRLHMAGLPDPETPCDRDHFEQWLEMRGDPS